MENNGSERKLVIKAELVNKALTIEFGKDVHPLLYDRAIRLINLQMDEMILEANQSVPTKIVTIPQPRIGNIQDMLKGKKI